MFLLPGCDCCKDCGPPQLSDMPDSIEVDLATASNRSATLSVGFTTQRPSISYTATMPDITATYQLAKVTSRIYQYSSSTVTLRMEFSQFVPARRGFLIATLAGSVGISNESSGVNCQNTFIDFTTSRTCDFTTASLAYNFNQAVLRENDNVIQSFPRLPCFSVQGAIYNPFFSTVAANSGIYYTEACRLPLQIDMDLLGRINAGVDQSGAIGFDEHAGLTSTFDYCTPATATFSDGNAHGFTYGFLVSFTVLSMRLMYESTSAPYFDDIGYTGCTVTP